MAKQEFKLLLRRGVPVWNRWRKENPLQAPDLSFCILDGVDLAEADLSNVRLYCTRLDRADLSRADLSEADLCGASLTGANLRGTDLSQSLFLTQTQINEAVGDRATLLPDGLERPRHWGSVPQRPKGLGKALGT